MLYMAHYIKQVWYPCSGQETTWEYIITYLADQEEGEVIGPLFLLKLFPKIPE